MEYTIDDKTLNAAVFLAFVNQMWPGNYDTDKTRAALAKTLNITAYDGNKLAGCLRILSDGYFFGTITELLVHPDYQKQGIGSRERNNRKMGYAVWMGFNAHRKTAVQVSLYGGASPYLSNIIV